MRIGLVAIAFAFIAASCATQLEDSPTSDEVLAEALPDTELAAEWSAPSF
jgi:hypothetical protein